MLRKPNPSVQPTRTSARRRFKALAGAALAVALLAGGCGSNAADTPAVVDVPAVVEEAPAEAGLDQFTGTWVLTSIRNAQMEADLAEVGMGMGDVIGAFGGGLELVFNADGSGEVRNDYESLGAVWVAVNPTTILVTDDGGDELELVLDGGALVMLMDDEDYGEVYIVFERPGAASATGAGTTTPAAGALAEYAGTWHLVGAVDASAEAELAAGNWTLADLADVFATTEITDMAITLNADGTLDALSEGETRTGVWEVMGGAVVLTVGQEVIYLEPLAGALISRFEDAVVGEMALVFERQ